MSKQDLTMRAAAVARMAPREWNDFLGALADYTSEETTNLVKSPNLAELPRIQGRAQMAAHLLDVFANCLRQADVTERKNNGRNPV